MKIGVLNWRDLAHSRSGGAEMFVDEVCKEWVVEGHEVSVVTSREPHLSKRESRGGVDIHRVGRLVDGSHHLLGPRMLRRRIEPDVVLESINTFPYMLPLRGRGIAHVPLVHQMARDVWSAELPRPLASVARTVEPHLFRPYRGVHMTAVSSSTRDDLVAAGIRDVTVVPQGGIGAQALQDKEESLTLIFVGRLAGNKQPDHAVNAFRLIKQRLPDAVLWIVGTGKMQHSLERDLPDGAVLLGHIPKDELFKRMGSAHLLLATSVREGWGLVVTEANALGTPAIAYDVPGLRDSVKDGTTGILVRPTPQQAADAACQLLQDTPRYQVIRDAAITWGSSFDWRRTAMVLLDELEIAAERFRGQGPG